LEVAARWLHFAGFSLGFGTVAFMLLVLPAGRIERLRVAFQPNAFAHQALLQLVARVQHVARQVGRDQQVVLQVLLERKQPRIGFLDNADFDPA